jgi:nitrous oxidase accessory protein NosD
MKILIMLASASMLLAQQNAMTIEPVTFAGSGLNDATSGGTFVAVPENHFYTAEICTTGTPDTVQFRRDGGTGTTCAGITTGAQPVYYPVPSVTSVAWSGGRATFTTSSAHGLKTGAKVTITGATPSGYNVSLASINVTGTSTFSISIPSNPGAYSNGALVRATDGVTITFAATTGHTAAARWTIRATANGSMRTSGFIQNGVGARFRDAQEKMREQVSALDYCNSEDVVTGSVNVSGCLQAALDASPSGASIYFPPGIYAVCTLSVSGKNLVITGAGSQISQIVRHSSCLNQNTNMVTIASANSLTIRDIGFDQKGTSTTTTRNAVFITQVSRVVADAIYVTRGQSAGLYVDRGSDIRITNSTFYQNWWIGIAIGGAGDTTNYPASGDPVQRIIIADNTFRDVAFGVSVQTYAYDTVVHHNIFDKSSIGIAQATYRIIVDGNSINGAHSYGIVENDDGIFLEAVEDAVITDNSITAPANNGIFLQGSSFFATAGATVQIPTPRFKISGNKLNNVQNGRPITVHASSPDGTPGRQGLVSDNTITNSHSCITVTGDMVKVSDNHCDTTSVQGYLLAGATNIIFSGNSARNIGVALPGSFNGLEIDTTSHDIAVENNHIIDDQVSHSMRFGIFDAALNAGSPSHVTYRNNVIVGSGAQQVFPVITCTPINGTWNFGEIREMYDHGTAGGDSAGCVNIAPGANSPGTWIPLSLIPDATGYYQVTDPADNTKSLNLGVDHASGEGDVKCFDLATPGYKACRTTGHGLKVINGDTGVTLWQVDAAGLMSVANGQVAGNLKLNGTLTPPTGTALNGATSCPTGQALISITNSQGVAIGATCGAAFPGGASVTDTRLDSCGLSSATTNVCTNAACTSTVAAITSVSLTCTQAGASFNNGLHQ